MRLIQFLIPDKGRRVGIVEEGSAFDLTSFNSEWDYLYKIFFESKHNNKMIDDYINGFDFRSVSSVIKYDDLLKHHPGNKNGWIIPPIDHLDSAHCLVTGTGLTHLGSMSQRNNMHKKTVQMTDSQKMFEMGLEGGKPDHGRGIQPEWFYKGTGAILRGHNDFLDIPSFSEDGGEEPEIVGCYIIGEDRIPYRLGFAIANEWSDHATERVNYLWLAPSKLRTCSIGPELITDQNFKNINGFCQIFRNDEPIYESGELLTGEDNMSHSLANLEDHHFKYPQFCIPRDVHIHFFGTMKLSYGSRSAFIDNDRIAIHFDGMGADLVNYVRRIPQDSTPITVLKA